MTRCRAWPGSDVDDVGALCIAHKLADRGEADILAITHDTGLEHGVGAISVVKPEGSEPQPSDLE